MLAGARIKLNISRHSNSPALMLLSLLLALLPLGSRTHIVQVRTTPSHLADSAPLTVFRVHGKLTEQVAATQLDKYGKRTVELEPGNYIFEVMHRPEDDLLVVLRSPQTKIDSASEVRLQGGAPRKLESSLNGRSS